MRAVGVISTRVGAAVDQARISGRNTGAERVGRPAKSATVVGSSFAGLSRMSEGSSSIAFGRLGVQSGNPVGLVGRRG
jgi:hypothetical protein